jgi:hypothetical protein
MYIRAVPTQNEYKANERVFNVRLRFEIACLLKPCQRHSADIWTQSHDPNFNRKRLNNFFIKVNLLDFLYSLCLFREHRVMYALCFL